MIIYIFVYNVIYIKSDFSKLRRSKGEKFILIASEYCLNRLDASKKVWFDAIHRLTDRDLHQVVHEEVERIVLPYVEAYGGGNIRLLTNEDSAHIVSARLREKYDIPGWTEDQILPFVNKVVSKQRLSNVVRLPQFRAFDKEAYRRDKVAYLAELEKISRFPMFAKPVDAVSSIETHKILNMPELEAVSERIERHSYEFEIDEFIEGTLYHCDAMIINGEVKFFMGGRCSGALIGFIQGKSIGSIQLRGEELSSLEDFSKIVFEKFKCPSGAYHMEVFLEESSQQYVFLEIGLRTGGAFICALYEKLFNINIEEINYAIQMGLIDDVKVVDTGFFGGFFTFPKKQGRVMSLNRPNVDVQSEFLEYVAVGELTADPENLLDMACGIYFWDKSPEKVLQIFEELKGFCALEVQQLYMVQAIEDPQTILESLLDIMPFVYWRDRERRCRGTNQNQAINFGVRSPSEYIGKTIFDVVGDTVAAKMIDENDRMVIENGAIYTAEEVIGGKTYLSQKGPIKDDKGDVMGMIGFSVDITEMKEKEYALRKERDDLYQVALKSIHDIRSPVASLSMMVECLDDLDPERFGLLREIALNINGIINNLLDQYRKITDPLQEAEDTPAEVIVSLVISEILNEKRQQCRFSLIRFEESFDEGSYFAVVKIDKSRFQRAISNIIDNAVEASMDNGAVVIYVSLAVHEERVIVTVKDQGPGIPNDVLQEIRSNVDVTSRKKGGKGLGFMQIREMTKKAGGELKVDSRVGEGATISVELARTQSVERLVTSLSVDLNTMVIILDGDAYIHGAWENLFAQYPEVRLEHFQSGERALKYIKELADKENVLFLCDFDLARQTLNGIGVIERAAFARRSILVTSHYGYPAISKQAKAANVKILPKQLLSRLPILFDGVEKNFIGLKV